MNILPKNNYSCTYRLTSKEANNLYCYIGSTKCFKDRLNSHRFRCRHNKIPHIYEKLGNDFNFEVIDEYENISTEDLLKKERELYDNCNQEFLLNKSVPSRTKDEWRKDNIEHYNIVRRAHYANNKEMFREKKRAWYAKNKDRLNANNREKKKQSKLIDNNDKLTVSFD